MAIPTDDWDGRLKLRVVAPENHGGYLKCRVKKGRFALGRKYKVAIWQKVGKKYYFHCPHCCTINSSAENFGSMCIICRSCDEHTFFTLLGAKVGY